MDARAEGDFSHAHLLALGLITRELHRSLVGPEEECYISQLTQEHLDTYFAVMRALNGMYKVKTLQGKDVSKHPLGYYWPTQPIQMNGEEGSPARAGCTDKRTAVLFIKKLCVAAPYTQAMASAASDAGKVINMVSSATV